MTDHHHMPPPWPADRLREALWQIIDGATEYTRTECAIARAALKGGGNG